MWRDFRESGAKVKNSPFTKQGIKRIYNYFWKYLLSLAAKKYELRQQAEVT